MGWRDGLQGQGLAEWAGGSEQVTAPEPMWKAEHGGTVLWSICLISWQDIVFCKLFLIRFWLKQYWNLTLKPIQTAEKMNPMDTEETYKAEYFHMDECSVIYHGLGKKKVSTSYIIC